MIQASKLQKITTTSLVAISIIVNLASGTSVAHATVSPSGDERSLDTALVDTRIENKPNFCTQLDATKSRLNSLVSQYESKLNALRADKSTKIATQFALRDSERAANRLRWDNERNTQYERLYSKATSDIQKQAIDQFKSTIEVAVNKRRAAVDSAVSTYRSTVQADMSTNQGSINSLAGIYKSAVVTAENKAQASCNIGTDPSVVRESFKSDLQVARTNLKTGKNGSEKINVEISALIKTRKEAIESAISDFKITLDQARETLNLALKQ